MSRDCREPTARQRKNDGDDSGQKRRPAKSVLPVFKTLHSANDLRVTISGSSDETTQAIRQVR